MNQPLKHITLNDREIILVGTAHISKESIEDVKQCVTSEQPDCVCVEDRKSVV